MEIPINKAFTMLPIAMERGSPHLLLGLFFSRYMKITIIILPTIMQGIMGGMADIIGLPVIKYAVTGVMTDKMMPQVSPTLRTARIRQALIIGPVMYTLAFLLQQSLLM